MKTCTVLINRMLHLGFSLWQVEEHGEHSIRNMGNTQQGTLGTSNKEHGEHPRRNK